MGPDHNRHDHNRHGLWAQNQISCPELTTFIRIEYTPPNELSAPGNAVLYAPKAIEYINYRIHQILTQPLILVPANFILRRLLDWHHRGLAIAYLSVSGAVDGGPFINISGLNRNLILG